MVRTAEVHPLCKRQQSSAGDGASFLIAVQDSAPSLDSVSWENKQEEIDSDLEPLPAEGILLFSVPGGSMHSSHPLILNTEDSPP